MASPVGKGPIHRYQSEVGLGAIQHDDAQLIAVEHPQNLFDELVCPEPKPGFFGAWMERFSGG